MNKKIIRIITVLLALIISCCMFTACSGSESGNGTSSVPSRPIDENKTLIRVKNYDGGVGAAWLTEARDRFEAAYAGVSFEDGKIGVQVEITSDKTGGTDSLKSSGEQLWFWNNINFNINISQGDFLKINDVVESETLMYTDVQEASIESLMGDDLKAALSAYDGSYYCLPTHQSFGGLTYNKTMFDNRGLYLLDDPTEGSVSNTADPRYGFMTMGADRQKTKSVGPDGLYNTEDDGLPSSIEEFKALCDCMVQIGVKPFVVYGSSGHYTQNLVQALWTNLEGADGVMLGLSFDSNKHGTTEIVKLDASGKVMKENGEILTETVSINNSNGYLTTRQASRYYALELMQYVTSNAGKYFASGSLDTATHTTAQFDFLRGEKLKESPAMLIEGNYWENEAKSSGKLNEVKTTYSDLELDYRFMPMPTQYEGRATAKNEKTDTNPDRSQGNKQTVADCLYYYGFINKYAVGNENTAEAKAAKAFLRFCFTEESMQKSTITTNLPYALNYDLESEQVANLTPYAKSIYDIKKYGNVLTTISSSQKFVRNMDAFKIYTLGSMMWRSNTNHTYPLNAFQAGMSVDGFFESMCAFHDSAWWNNLD